MNVNKHCNRTEAYKKFCTHKSLLQTCLDRSVLYKYYLFVSPSESYISFYITVQIANYAIFLLHHLLILKPLPWLKPTFYNKFANSQLIMLLELVTNIFREVTPTLGIF